MWSKRKNRPPREYPRLPRLARRLLIEVVGAAVILLLVYWGATVLEVRVIEHMSASGEVMDQELESLLTDLQAYVTKNDLSTEDAAALRKWHTGDSLIEIQLISQGTVIYDSTQYGWTGRLRSDAAFSRVRDPDLGVVHFSDADATVSVNPAFYHSLERRVTIIIMMVCFLLFILVIGFRFSRLVVDVLRIDQGVQMLESGDLTYRIEVRSPDEMAELAASLNRMAEELAWRNELEDKLHQQYYDMITAISHDLRTPLTAIMGYTELLQTGGETEQQRQDYLRRILDRAQFMRQMTNRLFDSARSRTGVTRQVQELEGQTTLAQLLDSMIRSLTVAGFVTSVSKLPGKPFTLQADPLELERVVSNLEGNIRSYADGTKPVLLRIDLNESVLHVVQSNHVRQDAVAGGSGVGLRAARGILENLGGSLETQRTEDLFTVDLQIPVQLQGENE